MEGAPARLNFTGTCAIVPSLQAPGFITAVTGKGLFRSESFVDVSACEGLTIKARDFSGGYKGYRWDPARKRKLLEIERRGKLADDE